MGWLITQDCKKSKLYYIPHPFFSTAAVIFNIVKYLSLKQRVLDSKMDKKCQRTNWFTRRVIGNRLK